MIITVHRYGLKMVWMGHAGKMSMEKIFRFRKGGSGWIVFSGE
jgi:hypothetical protein